MAILTFVEQIMAWWDKVQVEAERIARGGYPCEAPPAYGYFKAITGGPQVNGPAMHVGCWPRVLPGIGKIPLEDPAEEAVRFHLSPNVMPLWGPETRSCGLTGQDCPVPVARAPRVPIWNRNSIVWVD